MCVWVGGMSCATADPMYGLPAGASDAAQSKNMVDAKVRPLLVSSSFQGCWAARSASIWALVLTELQPMYDHMAQLFGLSSINILVVFIVYIVGAPLEHRERLEACVWCTIFEGVAEFGRPRTKYIILRDIRRATAFLRSFGSPGHPKARALETCGKAAVGSCVRDAVAMCHMDLPEEIAGAKPLRAVGRRTGSQIHGRCRRASGGRMRRRWRCEVSLARAPQGRRPACFRREGSHAFRE